MALTHTTLLDEQKLVFKGQGNTELMSIFIQAVCVYSSTNVDLDAGTNELSERSADDTRVGDLALDEGGAVKTKLSTDFESNAIDGSLVVPNSLTRRLQVRVDTMIVRSSVLGHVVSGMHSDSVFGGGVSDSTMISTDLP